jgi:hypothetical protein
MHGATTRACTAWIDAASIFAQHPRRTLREEGLQCHVFFNKQARCGRNPERMEPFAAGFDWIALP